MFYNVPKQYGLSQSYTISTQTSSVIDIELTKQNIFG